MSFDVKNIEQENINHKMIAPLTIVFIVGIVTSLVFVYYYFIFEKDYVMNDQYLGASSDINKEYTDEQNKKYDSLNMDYRIGQVIQEYSNNLSIEGRLNQIIKESSIKWEDLEADFQALGAKEKDVLKAQLMSDAFVELLQRGLKDKSDGKSKDEQRGVQAFYGERIVINIQWIIEDPDLLYRDMENPEDQSPDGTWGDISRSEWELWKERNNK